MSEEEAARILVVDDDPVALEMVRELLVEAGYRVDTATSWGEMGARLASEEIEVVVLDVCLPGLRGDLLAASILTTHELPPSVVLYSGLEESHLRRLARQCGAMSHVQKGDDPGQLLRVVQAAARFYRQRSARVDAGRRR